MEAVMFRSEDELIFGNLHLPRENSPCVVTLHGLESSKDSNKWLTIASRLYDEGIACLRFNFRGCGEGPERSEGRFEDVTLTGRIKDYKAALQFLQDTNKVNMHRLGVIGSSFGGMVAVAAQVKRISAVVALSTPYKIEPHSLVGLEKRFYEDLRKHDLLEATRSAPPTLILHGSSDEVVSFEHSQKLYEVTPEPKRLEIIEGADHVFSNSGHLDRVIDLSLDWFKKHL